EKLGTDKYLDYLKAFDFDKITGIDLPNEVHGVLLYNRGIEQITTSFGQGTTMTPIQQLKAATAIANDGEMVKPYVISSIKDSNTGKILEKTESEGVGKPISKDTAATVRDLMETVVNGEHGTGRSFKLDGYSLIGKTGTSQIPSEDGGFLTGRGNHIYSFLGMAPKDDPELMMYVSVKQPQLDETEIGSVPVSFIFKNVMENGLQYLNIEPDKESKKEIHTIEVGDVIGKKTKEQKKTLSDKGLKVTVIGSGKTIKNVSVKENSELFPGDRIILLADEPKMPDITGWSQRDVLQLADLLELDINVSGSGYVTKQSIKKDEAIKKGVTLEIELKSPLDDDDDS